MYLQKLTIENIRGLKHFEMTFPTKPAGWHVIIGDNGAGKSTLIRAIALGLIGPNEVRAAHPNFAEWLRKDAKKGYVELVIEFDKQYDFAKGTGKANVLNSKVVLQSSHSIRGLMGGDVLVEAVSGEHGKLLPDKYLWSNNAKGWFSAGFGPFRRFTGGDAEHDKVYLSSPRCGAHLSVFGEDVALTEALRWLQEIDYQQLKARENKARHDAHQLDLVNDGLSHGSEAELVGEAVKLWDIAERLQKNSLFKEAELLLRQAVALTEKTAEGNHPSVATGLNNLALLLQDTNRLSEAEPLLRQALAINEARYGLDHPSAAIYLNNLADLLQSTNRLSEAERLMRRALAINQKRYGSDHPNLTTSLNNLALLLQDTNRLSEAEPLLRQALAIEEARYGSDHPEVATGLSNLAVLLVNTNRLSEAELLMRRALAIAEASNSPDHPKLATRLGNLASLLNDTNRLSEAEPLMRRALAIAEAGYGPDHPDVATALNNLAALLHQTDRISEAESLLRRALAIDEASYGPNHPTVATGLNNLALLLQETNRISEAEPLIRRALAIDEASYGPNHPKVANRLGNLAILLGATERQEEAEMLMIRALAIDEASYGPDHPSVANDLNNLAVLLQGANRLSEAEPLTRRALRIVETSYGLNHPHVVSGLRNLVQLLLKSNRQQEAVELVQQYQDKNSAIPKPAAVTKAAVSQKLHLNEYDWLALRLRTFINGSKLLPIGTEFKEMSTDGPLFRDGNGQIVNITQLSDGFRSILSLAFELIRQLIRVYGLVAVFPPNGTDGVIELPGVVLIDEIDTHLHPTWQTRIGQWFTKCFPQLQFIVTTHSPLICRAVTETTGSIWRLPSPGQGKKAEEVTGIERQRLRLGTVLDAYGTGLFGGEEVEQASEAKVLLAERARLSAKEAVGKATAAERARLMELRQLFSPIDAEVEY